jgi:hypothetical protein
MTMNKSKPSLARSSTAEYLTFIAASGQGGVEAVYADENVWLTQKMLGQLYGVDVRTVNYHLKKVFADSELEAGSVIQNFRITASDGKTYNTQHYNLAAIIATTSQRKPPSGFLPPCKISCTGPFMGKQRQRSCFTVPTQARRTWV